MVFVFSTPTPTGRRSWASFGGRKNGRVPVETDPLPNLDSATAVRDAVARLIADVYSGKLNPRIAAGLAPLMHLQLRAIEKTDFEQRLAKLESQWTAEADTRRE